MTYNLPDLLRHAKDALTYPSDYSYHGDNDEMFISWGQSGPSRHRDSGALDNSNFESVLKYLQEKYPDDIREMRASHWAVGWMDCFEVRIIKDPVPEGLQDDVLEEDWITDCFKELHEICMDLVVSYPVFDESLHAAMEYQDCLEWLTFDGGFTDDEAVDAHDMLSDDFEHYCTEGEAGYSDSDLREVKMRLGLLDCEYDEDTLECSGEPATRVAPDGYYLCESCARGEGMDPVYPVLEGQTTLDTNPKG